MRIFGSYPSGTAESCAGDGTREFQDNNREGEISFCYHGIVANPEMIGAYKGGVPSDGQKFPDGSMIVKLQWKHKLSTEAPFVVEVPDVFKQVFVMEKDSKRFPRTGGWGYAVFNYKAASGEFTADPTSLADCGNACHTAVKSKDYIFHPYQVR